MSNKQLEQRIKLLEELASRYYTLLHVINEQHWERSMTPFWNEQRKKVQDRAEELDIRYDREQLEKSEEG